MEALKALPRGSRVLTWISEVGCVDSALQPGDLLFPSDPTQHVGMYVGNGRMVNATHPGDVVREHAVSAPGWGITYAVRPG